MELDEGVPVVENGHVNTKGKIALDAFGGDFGRRHMDIQNIPADLKSFIKLGPFPRPQPSTLEFGHRC
jgi:hypothetical protein